MNETANLMYLGSSSDGLANYSIFVTIVIFIAILMLIFIISKNLKFTIMGGVINGILFGIYKFSRFVGTSAEKGNQIPLNYTLGIIIFILLSWLVGFGLSKTKFGIEFFKGDEKVDE